MGSINDVSTLLESTIEQSWFNHSSSVVLGKERKPTPDLYAPFTPVTPPIEAESKEEPQKVDRFELAKRPFEK
ncbi:hypothetical protein HDU79_005978 [Rhizoclosmatium sp. JEL0117]|nr:hypothetical protein HDU79_005978 [Rhizoclosmatium sp. JEL0117]